MDLSGEAPRELESPISTKPYDPAVETPRTGNEIAKALIIGFCFFVCVALIGMLALAFWGTNEGQKGFNQGISYLMSPVAGIVGTVVGFFFRK